MTSPAKHRVVRIKATSLVLYRLGTTTVAAAVAMGVIGLSASAAPIDDVWDRVAQCESAGDWRSNHGNGFYGGVQFHQPTWVSFGGQEYASYAHQASRSEQIAVARRLLHAQGPGAWPVCSLEAGLTRSGGGADPNATPGGDPESTPAAKSAVTRYVSADVFANVRSGPGTDNPIVGTEPRGAKVSGTLSGDWLKIANGRYIGPAVLSASPVDSPAESSPSGVTRYISANTSANVRSGPGMSYGVVGSKPRGATVRGTMVEGWLKIGNGRYVGPAVISANPV